MLLSIALEAKLLYDRLHRNHDLVEGLDAAVLPSEDAQTHFACYLVDLEGETQNAVALLLLEGCWVVGGA